MSCHALHHVTKSLITFNDFILRLMCHVICHMSCYVYVQGKKLVLVDGVGYPAVGSVAGCSNADVAATLGAPVLIVG